MTYNRFLYNSALYNAGREEVGGISRSIIQAHTGPHVRAVVGSTSGISLVSDFTVLKGQYTNTPATAFNFPDLAAYINAVRVGSDDLIALLYGQAAKDLPAKLFPMAHAPDLPARIFGLFEANLGAEILGKLAEKDLAAAIFVAVHNLGGSIFGLDAPVLRGRIFGNAPGDLGAIIWAPEDLAAYVNVVQNLDLPASIFSYHYKDLPARMIGYAAPYITAFIRGFASATDDLPAYTLVTAPETSDLTASIDAGLYGFRTTLPAIITASTDTLHNLPAWVIPTVSTTKNLGAMIQQFTNVDLPATILLYGADNLGASIGTIAFGAKNKELAAFLQAMHLYNLAASITPNSNLANLRATISSLHGTRDLGAFIRASETFVTAILKVITLSGKDLRATIGRPDCAGGSAIKALGGYLRAQAADDLHAYIESYAQKNLGAVVNTNTIIHAFDTIDVSYSAYRRRLTKKLLTSDTIDIVYAPFRGANLLASITGTIPEKNLGATISAQFLLPRVTPFVSRLTSMDLRAGEDLDIGEVRLQMEGELQEFFYVHGTDDAFIRDANQKWKINVRSFKEIANNLFGDFASARVCRVADLTSFTTIDEAVRYCINAVLGLNGEVSLGATIIARGEYKNLPALLGVSDKYKDLGGIANRVFPSDLLNAEITPTGGYTVLNAVILADGSGSGDLTASIDPYGDSDLTATITGI